MRLDAIKITNYKSYATTENILIAGKFTVLVGQNNAGKTAFLEALRPSAIGHNPHREPKRDETFVPVLDPVSRVHLEISLSGRELQFRFLSRGDNLVFPVSGHEEDKIRTQIKDLFARENVQFEIGASGGGGWSSNYPAHRLFKSSNQNLAVRLSPSGDRQSWSFQDLSATRADGLPGLVGNYYNDALNIFRAERMNIGQSPSVSQQNLLRTPVIFRPCCCSFPEIPRPTSNIPNMSEKFFQVSFVSSRPRYQGPKRALR